MKNKETIDMLNELIIICNNRIQLYAYAESKTETFDLKALFSHLLSTSKQCREELIQEVKSLGGTVARGTSLEGVFYRVTKHIKKTVLAKNRRIILISCEFGESLVLNAYFKALENTSKQFDVNQLVMLNSQKTVLQTDQKYLTSFSGVFS